MRHPWLFLISLVAASSWSFTSAKLDISGTSHSIDTPVRTSLRLDDKVKLSFTVNLDDSPKKPHQSMLLLKNPDSKLEGNLVVPVKSNGRGILTFNARDINIALLSARKLELSLIIAGGEGEGVYTKIAELSIPQDEEIILPTIAKYASLPEITHTFNPTQTMPPVSVSLVFTIIVLLGPIGLGYAWFVIGVNFDAAGGSLKSHPIAYIVFFASLSGIEGVLFLYWLRLKIMPVLGLIAALSVPLFFSGRSALSEVEGRRKAGLR